MKIQTTFPKTSSRVPSCTQPCLWIRVTRRRYLMAQDSDDPIFIFNIVVWVWVVILVIVALLCHYREELYGDEPSDVINVSLASWD